MALGNVIGSNIANVGLILGVAALIRPPRVDGALRRRELPVLVASTALVPLLLLDGSVSRWEGGGLLVGAVSVARALGMSERLVGLTIVAVGTSLPELVTSVIAARRGHSDLAVGNVVGSNIFNTFLCLGAASLAGSVAAPLPTLGVDLAALGVMTALAAAFIRTERTISRREGATAVVLYAAFAVVTVARG